MEVFATQVVDFSPDLKVPGLVVVCWVGSVAEQVGWLATQVVGLIEFVYFVGSPVAEHTAAGNSDIGA